MVRQTYTAAKTRSQGRSAWAISFRHPVKRDPRTNSGMKIRRGLGTSDDAQADQLVDQMNILLGRESWWSISQRERASREFAPVIVSAFFDSLEPESRDTAAIREHHIAMPDRSQGYARILFVGTTGAGKTTLLRHMIGSDHKHDRFPSTSTAKCTICDIEVITGDPPYEAVVTFLDEWRVHTYIVECVVAAGLAAWEGGTDEEVVDRLLHHSDQRFRLSYVLGRWNPNSEVESDADWTMMPSSRTDSDQEGDDDDGALSETERHLCQEFLKTIVSRIRAAAEDIIAELRREFGAEATDPTGPEYDVYQDLFESELESCAAFDDIVKDIVDEVRIRFDQTTGGELQRRKSGWPESWRLMSEDRDSFVQQIRWFSSNHTKSHGQLLTPLVDGIRLRGPFHPRHHITERQRKFVFVDGQGLGHTPDSSASITTHITSKFGSVDVILLVDSAEQPVQAAPLSALRAILSGGHQRKLAVAFTHFDNVRGDNLPGPKEKRDHVMASVRSGIGSFKDMGHIAVSSLLRGIDSRSFMLGYLDQPSSDVPKGFVRELDRLLGFFENSIKPAETIDLQPRYDMSGLAFAVQEAADDFNKRWAGVLGLGSGYGYKREHWTRIKALTRRFALQWDVEYDTLQPVADLVKRLEESILRFLEKPLDWSRRPKDEDEAEAVLSEIRQEVSADLHELAKKRISAEHIPEWVEAYNRRGTDSTFVRAREVMNIYDAAAPIPGTVVDRIAAGFLQDVRQIVGRAIEDNGGIIEGT